MVLGNVDLARHGETEAERAAAKTREELLTPLSKAWSTDMGVEAASLGVQIHGGMGFIEETGAAQHYRDARITPIYEGTNGIQAIDLIGRKLSLEGGEAIRRFLGEMAETATACDRANREDLKSIGRELTRALKAAESATAWLQTTMRTSPQQALPGATPYLRLFGTAAGGCLIADEALLAMRANDESARRTALARFFAENIAVQAGGLENAVVRGGGSIVSAENALS